MTQEQVQVTFTTGGSAVFPRGTTLAEISRTVAGQHASPIVAAEVDSVIKDLATAVETDCTVRFLDLHDADGNKIYQRSLTFVLIRAAQELFPDGELTVEHSISRGLFCELHIGRPVTADDVDALARRMQAIVAADEPFVRRVMPAAQAIALFSRMGMAEKAAFIEQLGLQQVSVYYCGDVPDYFYRVLVPSTGYLRVFALRYYPPGLLLQYPEAQRPDTLPPFIKQPKLMQIFREAEQWGQLLHCAYVSDLNRAVHDGAAPELIRVAEALHEKKIAQIADYLTEHHRDVRVILVAGPSSSGKTTFAQRLRTQLRVNGLRPVSISLDDYFVDRQFTPRDERGDYDFESIEALDLELFNDHLTRLLAGEEVKLPTYNFVHGQREYRGHKIRIDADQPLIIEGIHGLNERLTASVPRRQKCKIYISALTQLGIDRHNRIPTTDTRLIRRIVRDSQFRAHDAGKTLAIWPSVRRGEEKNIFPFQEEADVMFNTALIYEWAVLKKYAVPLLKKIAPSEPTYSEARRLLHFLAFFFDMPDEEIPPTSILREFIGGCCFFPTS